MEPPERLMSEHQVADGLAEIRSMWEMAAVLRFLST